MSNDKLFGNTRYCISQWLVKCEDSLPEAPLGFRSILLLISFVNQAFLGLQFFQVQGRNQAFTVVRMKHNSLSFPASIQIFSRKDNRMRYSFDIK